MKSVEILIQEFREKGKKVTPQRIAICKYLHNNKSHPTADEIYKALKVDYPSISLNTIYKTLDLLINLGEIKKLPHNPKKNNFDPETVHHHHLVCNKCDKIMDVQYNFSKFFSLPKKLTRNFKIKNFQVAFEGLCETCQGNH